ncbi:CocE/NonD family hydrolase [Kitasatospora aburaviensis]
MTDEPVPAVLEYSAGRLTDWTATDDARRHPWYAGHGYACLRVDARGHGNSGGLPADPPDGEPADGAEVLAWLAAQPWCSGRIGLLGTGAAGRTALRLAARAPGAVHAVVAACPEVGDRLGGAAPAADLHVRATTRLADAARPPDPQYVGDDWRRMWRERLESLEPSFPQRLAAAAGEPAPDEPPGTAVVPTFAVAGWGDPSCSTLLELLSGPVPVRAVLGPWPHGLPDEVLPETLRWWDHWLRDVDSGVLKTPSCAAGSAAAGPARRPGPPRRPRDPLRPRRPAAHRRHRLRRPLRPGPLPQHTGLNAGAYVPLGRPADLPPDQREEDGRSVCFDSLPLPEPLELLGTPSLQLRLRPHRAPA